MKKFLILFCFSVLAFGGLAGCGKGEKAEEGKGEVSEADKAKALSQYNDIDDNSDKDDWRGESGTEAGMDFRKGGAASGGE
jgi:hypothetical protein